MLNFAQGEMATFSAYIALILLSPTATPFLKGSGLFHNIIPGLPWPVPLAHRRGHRVWLRGRGGDPAHIYPAARGKARASHHQHHDRAAARRQRCDGGALAHPTPPVPKPVPSRHRRPVPHRWSATALRVNWHMADAPRSPPARRRDTEADQGRPRLPCTVLEPARSRAGWHRRQQNGAAGLGNGLLRSEL